MISVNGVTLPGCTQMQVDDELIWTSDSGRDLSGLFSGSVIAQKQTVTVTWEFLTQAETALIKEYLCAGFFPVTFRDAGKEITIQSYRGTLSKVLAGTYGGETFYRTVSCKIIQR